VIVAGAGLSLAPALRWSQQLNENAKLPCFALEVPEMLHNQVEGLEAAARAGTVLVLLTDHGQSYSEGAAMDYLGSVYEGFGGTAFAVASRGTHELERIFSLMYIGDQVSYLASLLRGMDPTPVERIGHLKKVLAPGSS
jgi:glucose/mannose-6-phosphate isomerase